MSKLATILRQTAESESFRYIVESRHLLQAADEIDRLNKVIEVMDKKQRHGCYDANCKECDE